MMGAVASTPAPIRFRPMPLPELLDELFRLYRRHFSLIVGVSLLVALPGLVWSLVTGVYRLNSGSYASLFTTTPGTTPTFNSQQLSNLIGALALGFIGGFFLAPISLGAVFRVVGIMQGIISYGLVILVSVIAALVSTGDFRAAVVQVVGTLVSAVVTPIAYIAVVLLYFDLRVRKEGLDLDQLAQQTSPGPA